MSQKQLTLPLTSFLDYALGSVVERISVDVSLARAIEAIDKDEQLCHIEWIDADHPILWRIAEWRTSSKREAQKKELASRERTVWVHVSELRDAMARRIATMTGLPLETANDMAAQFVKTRNVALAATFGTDIAPILKAEDELRQYQETLKQK